MLSGCFVVLKNVGFKNEHFMYSLSSNYFVQQNYLTLERRPEYICTHFDFEC